MSDNNRKRSGISSDRAYRIQRKMISKVADIYSTHVHFHTTYEDCSEALRVSVLSSAELALCPERVRAYIDGYCEAMRDQVWRRNVMWVLSCDGKLMTSKEVDELTRVEEAANSATPNTFPTKEYRSPWSRIDSDLSRHVWKSAEGLPMYDKPFTRKFQAVKEVKEVSIDDIGNESNPTCVCGCGMLRYECEGK